MRPALRAGVLITAILSLCAPAAAALTFVEAPGSPYGTTDQHFLPSGGRFLGGAVAGDFNGDGISDLAVVNATGLPAFSSGESVTVLLGHPNGELTMAPGSPIELYSGGMYASYGAIAAGDFTSEDKLDLAVVDNIHDTVSVLLGDGTGHFRPYGSPIHFSGAEPTSIAVGDFTENGIEDLAFASGGEVNVLLGDGSGGFAPAPKSPFAVGGYAMSVAAGDFNGDDLSDLAVTTTSDQVGIYLASGDGRFEQAPGSPLATGAGPGSILAANLAGNGPTDLAIANSASDNVTVLLGNGSGQFTPAAGSPFALPADAGGSPQSIAVGDFNGDDADLAVANFSGSADDVAILRGNGRGGFTNAVGSPFPANGNPGPLVVGDFNGDGRPDLAAVNSFEGLVTVLQNTTAGEPEEAPPVGETPRSEEAPLPPVKAPTGTLPSLAAPTEAQLRALIARELGPAGNWAKLQPSSVKASFEFEFKALAAGTAVVEWYALPDARQHAQNAHARPVLIASGRLTFSAASTKMMRIGFTRAGRRRWARAKQLELLARGSFTPTGRAPIVARRTVTLEKES
jgi:hypothetical protein